MDKVECRRVDVNDVVSVVCSVVRALVLPNFIRLQNAEDVVTTAQQLVQRLRSKEAGVFPKVVHRRVRTGRLVGGTTTGIWDGRRLEKRHSPVPSELAH